ncbi:atrial natriuretic peptide clearance receptor [Elysia marginata]|uniref:Atrial natriuretic peptide clearance receptor n=1 Tax=Elysia marginata TaxID=1093978 RepID=A0AAV4H9K9_9GAST|nr:atrial natriuretic peptide clearance receptor [Elysia marginata]
MCNSKEMFDEKDNNRPSPNDDNIATTTATTLQGDVARSGIATTDNKLRVESIGEETERPGDEETLSKSSNTLQQLSTTVSPISKAYTSENMKKSNAINSSYHADIHVPEFYKLGNAEKMSENNVKLRNGIQAEGSKSYDSITTESIRNPQVSSIVAYGREEISPTSLNTTKTFSHPPLLLEANLVLLVPESDVFMFSRRRIITALDIARENLITSGVMSDFRIRFLFGNSECSEILGPIRAFEFFWKGRVDAFLGPACDYSVAPVARYAAYWQVPVLSPGALSFDFVTNKKSQYRSLTRVGASLTSVALLLMKTMERYGWGKVVLVYDPVVHISKIPRLCFLAASAISYISKLHGFEAKPEFSGDPEKVLRGKVGTDYAGE